MIKIIDESYCPLCGRTEGNFSLGFCDENKCSSIIYGSEYKMSKLLSNKFIKECEEEVKKGYNEINRTIKNHSDDYAKLEFDMLTKIYLYLYKKDNSLWQLKSIKDRLEHFEYNYGFELNLPVCYCDKCGAKLKEN